MADSTTAREIDAAALDRAARRISAARDAPWLHAEVARRMAERLAIVRLQPARVIDWWGHAGAGAALLAQAYPHAERVAIETPAARAARLSARNALPWWSPARWREIAAVDVSCVAPGSAQLVWANMMLHLVRDPGVLLQAWHSALSVDGFVMLSTLGPDTLKTLREVYREAGWGPPHAAFTDMHDLGDMLVRAGFADPVMDQELLRLTWASPDALLTELRGLGGNADPGRHAGLRTPRWRSRLAAAIAERAGPDGRVALEFEIVYGHAFKPPPKVSVAAETRLDVDAFRQMARGGRRGRSLS
ncbi:MAG: biotin synthase [Aquincola sp.]|nr:biotin synthase [Aquincola sp.]MDH4288970.1 biotin synthase [Aquincola sp.]MDH5330864.1 biotin synthase [Aquincola sp.]